MKKTCKVCKRHKKHAGHGLCDNCRRFHHPVKIPCSYCKEERPFYAKDLCYTCYSRSRRNGTPEYIQTLFYNCKDCQIERHKIRFKGNFCIKCSNARANVITKAIYKRKGGYKNLTEKQKKRSREQHRKYYRKNREVYILRQKIRLLIKTISNGGTKKHDLSFYLPRIDQAKRKLWELENKS